MSDSRAKTKDVVISYDEARDMLENEELKRPNYLYELRYETINKESFVDFDKKAKKANGLSNAIKTGNLKVD